MIDALFNILGGLVVLGGPVVGIVWLISFASRRALAKIEQEKLHPAHRTCPKCGYDLRATPESCPECGHVVIPERRPADLDFARMQAEWPLNPRSLRHPGLHESLQPIWLTDDPGAARLLADFLKDCGICPSVKTFQRQARSGTWQIRSTIAQVQVWDEDLQLATDLLARFTKAAPGPDLTP